MKALIIIALLFLTMLAGGCATLTTGTDQGVTVQTPGVVGAKCVVLQPDRAPLPIEDSGEVIVPRGNFDLTVECEKEGYALGRTVVKAGIDSHAKIELPIGYIIDAMTGARYRYPGSVQVDMVREK